MNRNPKSGVTLLETMIALAVMAMIGMIVSSGFSGIARSSRSSAEFSDAITRAEARHDLRQWLERALSAPFPGYSEGALKGTADDLRFSLVDERGLFWAGDPVFVTLDYDDLGQVVLKAVGSKGDGGPQIEKVQVLGNYSSQLSIEYFGQLAPMSPIQWNTEWRGDAGLPLLVRIAISDDGMAVPPITIRPAKALAQSEMSLSSLVPPSLPSLP